jgi:hypothetical protein
MWRLGIGLAAFFVYIWLGLKDLREVRALS